MSRGASRATDMPADRWLMWIAVLLACFGRPDAIGTSSPDERSTAACWYDGVEVELLRAHPHLHVVHGFAAVVPLGVLDPRAGAHPLGQARVDDTAVAFRIPVRQGPAQYPGDDLQVLVRVGAEAGAGGNGLVVVREQEPEPDVRRVVVRPERERVPRVEPLTRRPESVAARRISTLMTTSSTPSRPSRSSRMVVQVADAGRRRVSAWHRKKGTAAARWAAAVPIREALGQPVGFPLSEPRVGRDGLGLAVAGEA